MTCWPGVTERMTFSPIGAGADLVDEVLDHRQGDIGLDQGGADFAQGGVHIGFGQGAAAAELVEDATQAGLQTFKQIPITPSSYAVIPTGFAPGGATALPGGDPPRRAGDRKVETAFRKEGGF